MAVTWTEEQRKVIELRDRNILVSAAAGSGKTAVLVERILSRITDPDDPVDVDELLVVTFTRAAAAQMRERIGQAIKNRLRENPEDVHLQRQTALLHCAQITTIDSFCLHVLRSHFDELDLDPDFRIGDEGELKMLRGDLIEELMEDFYQSGDEEYGQFIEAVAVGKEDAGVREQIERLYSFVISHPFPEDTLKAWAQGQEESWLAGLMDQIRTEADSLAEGYDKAVSFCMTEPGLSPYAQMFLSDRELARRVAGAADYDGMWLALEELTFSRKPVIRDKNVDPASKEEMSALRDRCKKVMQKWKEYDFGEPERLKEELARAQAPVQMLCRLTGEFMERYSARKKEKHMLDFSDLEHLALQILVSREDGQVRPTAVARLLSSSYREIMIDEYQDSNEVQELLLSSIDGSLSGRPNRFMVGDVKQSIYKFRMARPEIFMEKYETYSLEESVNQRIDLHKNFRSRREVLDAANFVFRRLMDRPIGGIAYNDANALYTGAVYPEMPVEEGGAPADYTTELLLVDLADEEGTVKEIEPKEAEARAIAGRIRELTDEQTGLDIWDKEQKRYRKAQYGDIVILLRTFSGWAETFVNVLQNDAVPAYAQSASGYFTAMEVQTVLNYLRILDNPEQDIPLAAVMHSPMGGFASEELAKIKAGFRRAGSPGQTGGLYGACLYFAGEKRREDELGRKVRSFLNQLSLLRSKAVYLSVYELLDAIYQETGYLDLVSVMPDGNVRRANLEMLSEKAVAYAKTSYYGLFDFVRYIENLHKYEVDFGEASPEGEGGGTVRITTIHKSKGLEYPIVFVAGTGKSFNRQDSRSRILMHPDLGLAADWTDGERRLRGTTLKKQALAKRLDLDSLGEELRVLYVAMTRAEQKLILTGTDRSLQKKLAQKWETGAADGPLPFFLTAGAGSYLDWLLMCLETGGEAPIRPRIVHFTELLGQALVSRLAQAGSREDLERKAASESRFPEIRGQIVERLAYRYPYEEDETLPVKLSVSELKHAAMEEEPEMVRIYEEEREETLPRFLQESRPLAGALRGTVYHRVLEQIDMEALVRWAGKNSGEELARFLDGLWEKKVLSQGERDAVKSGDLMRFGRSPEALRMARAAGRGQLYREQPFSMGISAGEIYPDRQSKELVVVQGIIDVCWQEEGGLYILDYKTDRVRREDGQQALIARYSAQLYYYARALSAAYGLPVKECFIYSFALGRAFAVPVTVVK